MAYIESHQALGQHPKLKRLARLLGCGLPCAVGHLNYLWWWALDYAPDGSLAKFDADVIADACLWEGDAAELVQAMKRAGFLDDELTIHDWFDYAGKLVLKRQADAARKRADRHATSAAPSLDVERRPVDIAAPSNGHPADGAGSLAKPSLAKRSVAKPNGSGPRKPRGAAPTLRAELETLVTGLLDHPPNAKQTRQLAYHDGLSPRPTDQQYRSAIGRALALATGDPIAYAMSFIHDLPPEGAPHAKTQQRSRGNPGSAEEPFDFASYNVVAAPRV